MNSVSGLVLVILTTFLIVYTKGASVNNVKYLENDEVYKFDPGRYSIRQLQIFCYEGKPKYIIHVWQSVFLRIIHPTDDYNQFDGASPEQVQKEYTDNRYSWSLSFLSSKSKNLKLNPFNTSCIGIDSRDSYTVTLKVVRIDLWKVISLVLGILLFLSAPTLSQNSVFHYVCGISFGISASFLILIYFISKLFPRKSIMYGVIGAGWTLVIYFLQMLWDNIKVIMSIYRSYVIWYTVITGTISFILCYRWGPVANQRTINLIKWALQLLGLISIYLSSDFQEAAMGQIVFVLLATYLPRTWVLAPKRYWKKRFPPKLKPLSNDEYYEEGVRETTKALKELREYCSSPKCNQWKTALKLKDVKRFASFIEGNSHLSDDEILEYETSIQGELTDDSESERSAISEDEGSS